MRLLSEVRPMWNNSNTSTLQFFMYITNKLILQNVVWIKYSERLESKYLANDKKTKTRSARYDSFGFISLGSTLKKTILSLNLYFSNESLSLLEHDVTLIQPLLKVEENNENLFIHMGSFSS